MQNTFIVRGIIVAALLIAGFLFFAVNREQPQTLLPQSPAPEAESQNTYTNQDLGFSFQYPGGYDVAEREVGNAERAHYVIVLTEQGTEAVLNGEGPVSITIDVFQNIEGYDTLTWVKGSNDSNFKLGDGTYNTANVAGIPAITYRASGLYESDNTVFIRGSVIYKLTVHWLTPEDAIVGYFRNITDSFAFGS